MKRLPYYALTYYDKNVVGRIVEKYDMGPKEARLAFLTSETHAMLEDAELSMWDFSERVAGDPRNSVYLRSME